MSPEEYATVELLKEELSGVLLTLTDREERVLRLRFESNRTNILLRHN